MHMDTDRLYYGNYRFVVELDTGSETGGNQLTIWVAEKVNVDMVPLSQFKPGQLLKALNEPQKTRLSSLIEAEKRACRRPFENEISQLHADNVKTTSKGKKKLPGKVQCQIAGLCKQMEKAIRQLETKFAQRELLNLERHLFDRDILQSECRAYENEQCLRDFYFEEANDNAIHEFCFTYASDKAYRQKVLHGETRWAKRNALFVENLPAVYSTSGGEREYDRQARSLFHWLNTHLEAILALPEYQRLQEMDSACQPCTRNVDPLLRPAVEILNQVPGVTTKFSCQGISGKVRFQDHDLLVVSPHEEYAYISFATLGQMAHDTIITLLHEFPGITTSNTYARVALCSAGDNLRFRTEVLMLARRLLESVDASWSTIPETDDDLTGRFVVQSVPLPEGTSLPVGILPARLEWLCRPEQIERTLSLLFYLNHWAKTCETLLYDDCQGLYEVKAAILQKAYEFGLTDSHVYIDGSQNFACNFSFDMATEIAAETFLFRLSILFKQQNLIECEDKYDLAARYLFKRIMRYEASSSSDVKSLNKELVETAIHSFLQELVTQARLTRQPIATSDLEALHIAPMDLIDLQGDCDSFSASWDNLGESDRRKLDPEGLSLIAFQYRSPTAQYTFHLPFRIAETFLPEKLVYELRNAPGTSREDGIFYRRAITDAESQQYPVEEILRELGVDIAAICPHKLIHKQEHVAQRPNRYPYWYNDENGEYEKEAYEEEAYEQI